MMFWLALIPLGILALSLLYICLYAANHKEQPVKGPDDMVENWERAEKKSAGRP